MIELYCENCGRKVVASKIHSGKICRCPGCKEEITVPAQEATIDDKDSVSELTFLDDSELNEIRKKQESEFNSSEEAHEQEQQSQEAECHQERWLPWQVDIFLYPINRSGLRHLAFFIGLPLLLEILLLISPVPFLLIIAVLLRVVNIAVFLYFYWYLAECIRDSADGWVRAPEGMGGMPDLFDMLMQIVNIIGCLGFFLLPAIICVKFVGWINVITWLFIIAALFFYPFGLLSVILFDSFSGLDPRVLIRSIRDIFWPYVGLVVLFTVMLLLALIYAAIDINFLWKTAFRFCVFYLALILAHLTGRFYFRYKDKLQWKISDISDD